MPEYGSLVKSLEEEAPLEEAPRLLPSASSLEEAPGLLPSADCGAETEAEAKHRCVWKDEEEIFFAGYMLGEHARTWGTLVAGAEPPAHLRRGGAVPTPATDRLNVTVPRGLSLRSPRRAPPPGLGQAAWTRMARNRKSN